HPAASLSLGVDPPPPGEGKERTRVPSFRISYHRILHQCPTCCSTFTGTVNEKVEPSPRWESTQMRPPCISTIRLEIDRPSPVPPFFLVAELSACWNSSKILPRSASEMPGPVSCTESVYEPLAA